MALARFISHLGAGLMLAGLLMALANALTNTGEIGWWLAITLATPGCILWFVGWFVFEDEARNSLTRRDVWR